MSESSVYLKGCNRDQKFKSLIIDGENDAPEVMVQVKWSRFAKNVAKT